MVVYLNTCSHESGKEKIQSDTLSVEVDTTIKTIVDTQVFNDTIVHTIKKAKPTRVDTVYVSDSTDKLEYMTPYEDSLIEGNITSRVLTDGTLVNTDLNYIPKFPKYIKRTDSVFVDKEVTIDKNRMKFFIGGFLSPSVEKTIIGPKATLYLPSDITIGYGYGLNDSRHYISLEKKISLGFGD